MFYFFILRDVVCKGVLPYHKHLIFYFVLVEPYLFWHYIWIYEYFHSSWERVFLFYMTLLFGTNCLPNEVKHICITKKRILAWADLKLAPDLLHSSGWQPLVYLLFLLLPFRKPSLLGHEQIWTRDVLKCSLVARYLCLGASGWIRMDLSHIFHFREPIISREPECSRAGRPAVW